MNPDTHTALKQLCYYLIQVQQVTPNAPSPPLARHRPQRPIRHLRRRSERVLVRTDPRRRAHVRRPGRASWCPRTQDGRQMGPPVPVPRRTDTRARTCAVRAPSPAGHRAALPVAQPAQEHDARGRCSATVRADGVAPNDTHAEASATPKCAGGAVSESQGVVGEQRAAVGRTVTATRIAIV